MATLILLPGLGADERLFDGLRPALAFDVPPWLTPHRDEPLAAFAARMARAIDYSADALLGGASIGGMIALEMARVRPCRGVFLLASTRGPLRSLPAVRWVFRRLPAWCFGRAGRLVAPVMMGQFRRLPPGERRLFREMFAATVPAFIKWGMRAASDWPGAGDPGVPVWHLHGRHDRMIPLADVTPDQVIDDAGHLITLSHSRESADFIAARMRI